MQIREWIEPTFSGSSSFLFVFFFQKPVRFDPLSISGKEKMMIDQLLDIHMLLSIKRAFVRSLQNKTMAKKEK
jgi:hypothetical protein